MIRRRPRYPDQEFPASMTTLSDSAIHLGLTLRDDFHRALLDASLRSLEDPYNSLRFNNFCSGFRELVRHVFNKLAPDEELKATSWYVPDKTARTGVTRAQRIAFVLHGGLSASRVEHLIGTEDAIAMRRALIKSFDLLNKFVHVNEDTFGLPPGDIEKYVDEACDALYGMLNLAQHARDALARAIESVVRDEVVTAAIATTIETIDIIATHHSIEGVLVDCVRVVRIGSERIEYLATGTVAVELQWGSARERNKGEGAVASERFPFVCKFSSSIDDPDQLEMSPDGVKVDDKAWFGLDEDDDPMLD